MWGISTSSPVSHSGDTYLSSLAPCPSRDQLPCLLRTEGSQRPGTLPVWLRGQWFNSFWAAAATVGLNKHCPIPSQKWAWSGPEGGWEGKRGLGMTQHWVWGLCHDKLTIPRNTCASLVCPAPCCESGGLTGSGLPLREGPARVRPHPCWHLPGRRGAPPGGQGTAVETASPGVGERLPAAPISQWSLCGIVVSQAPRVTRLCCFTLVHSFGDPPPVLVVYRSKFF